MGFSSKSLLPLIFLLTYSTIYSTIKSASANRKGGIIIEVQLNAQPRKYLASVDERTRKKLFKALDGLRELKGDIVKLKGHPNHYRLKIHHYRILFSIADDGAHVSVIIVDTINTRTNIKY